MTVFCNFKNADGTWNIVEDDQAGNIRVECVVCGNQSPPPQLPPRSFRGVTRIKARCGRNHRAERLAAQAAQQAKSCPEKCINKADAAQATLLAELTAAVTKAKENELQAVLERMLDHAQRNEIDRRYFQQARELAVKQALAEGKQAAS
jgi:hypothetical protein